MDRLVYIYMITNKINGKIYIGKSQEIKTRWARHIRSAKNKINRYLYDAVNHYGYDNFEIEKIEECENQEIASVQEKCWIKYYRSNEKEFGYNMTIGGDGGDTWSKNENKEITSKKISTTNTGKKRDAEFCNKMKEISKNRMPMTQETKDKIRDSKNEMYKKGLYDFSNNWMRGINPEDHPMFGKHHTDESKEKISKSRLGKSYEEIFGEELANLQKEKKKIAWTKSKNPNYKCVDPSDLIYFLDLGYNNNSLSEYFEVAKTTIIEKVKEILGMTPTQYRKSKNIKMIKENKKCQRDS